MTSDDLKRWLDHVTCQLPEDVADMIREEITAHYDDAVADALVAGCSPEAAHQQAMAALGSASDVAAGFNQTHHAPRHYLIAAVMGMLYPLAYLASIPLNIQLSGEAVFNLTLFLPLLYVAYGFKTMLAQRPHGADMRLYERIIHTGIVAMCVPRFFSWMIYHQPIITETYTRSLAEAHSTIELALNGMALIGLLLVALGFVLLGERTLHLRETLYGLLKPAGILVIGCGLCLAGYSIGVVNDSSGLRTLTESLAVITGMIAVMLWSFIFFRARSEITLLAA
jgi:hypothetical protein